MNKSFLYGILMIILSASALAWGPRDIGGPVWDNVRSMIPGVSPGYVNSQIELFYPVEQWEIDTCKNGLTSENAYKDPAGVIGESTDFGNIYADTATISATRLNYTYNDTLYVVGWYVQPKDADIQYDIYLIDSAKKKKYLDKNRPSDATQGDAGYYTEYLAENYVRVEIVYSDTKTLLHGVNIADVTNNE